MKKFLFLMLFTALSMGAYAKKYPWKGLDHEVVCVQTKPGKNGERICRAQGIAGNAEKAIDQAMQDAVVAALFYGIQYEGGSSLPPMIKGGADAYAQNKEALDNFFKNGDFMNYVQLVGNHFPSGEDNQAVSGGRKVMVTIKLLDDQLRKAMEKLGLKISLNSFF